MGGRLGRTRQKIQRLETGTPEGVGGTKSKDTGGLTGNKKRGTPCFWKKEGKKMY